MTYCYEGIFYYIDGYSYLDTYSCVDGYNCSDGYGKVCLSFDFYVVIEVCYPVSNESMMSSEVVFMITLQLFQPS